MIRLGPLIPADGGLLVCSHGRCVWLVNGFIQRTNAQQCDVMDYKMHSCVVRSPAPKKEDLLCWRASPRAQAPLVPTPHVTHWRLCADPG